MRAVVVAGGEADPGDVAYLDGADLVVAADGGAEWLERSGRRPDLLVGDLDSVDASLVERLRGAGVPVEIHPTDKDATDAELAVARAAAAGATQIVLLGALAGRRLDHELANLLLLAGPAAEHGGRDLRLVRGSTVVRAVHAPGRIVLEGRRGTTVSLLPVGGDTEGVRTDGLHYPLAGERLPIGTSRGISNRVSAEPASVSVEHGVLLVIELNQADRKGADP